MAIKEETNWRENIIIQLRERNRTQTHCYEDLIHQSKIYLLDVIM